MPRNDFSGTTGAVLAEYRRMPRNDFLVRWGNIYRIQWVIAYETFGYHTEFLVINFLCGFDSGNGTDAKYYVVITCAGRRR